MDGYFPIKNITTYTTNWTVLARIVNKPPMHTIKGSTHLLSIDIVDKNDDIIRCKFWDKAAEKWNEILQNGKVYTFSKGNVVVSNKKFNTLPHHYEINFNQDSVIEPAEDMGEISSQGKYEFVSFRDIKSSSSNTPFTVDILGIVRSVGPEVKLTTKAGKEILRRSIILVDDSNYELELTLWEPLTSLEFLDHAEHQPLIASQIIIRDWQGGRNAQSTSRSVIKIADKNNVKDKNRLMNLTSWFEQASTQNDSFKTMRQFQGSSSYDATQFTTIANVVDKLKGNYEFICKLRRINWRNKDNKLRLWYQACPMCTKKVVAEESTGSYRCFSCDDALVVPQFRFIFTCALIDYTGQVWANVYGDLGLYIFTCKSLTGDKIIGQSAAELSKMETKELKKIMEYDILHKVFVQTRYKCAQDYKIIGFIRAKEYNGENRHVFNVARLEPLNYANETETMLKEMEISYDRVQEFLGIIPKDGEIRKKQKV
ncbi:bifunctional Replication factor A [Babesia duncani]|uniref:Bifunctional Replication factor A n=1 Tax=Babesia duncani TaxID=323732 RepID=A0AAD9UP81_9APIC|nr:bifunctional Replication factor A [Babesia duncani]